MPGLANIAGDREDHGAAGSGTVRILVLGPLSVEHEGRPIHVAGSHRRRLLAFLASRGGRSATVDSVAEALWGDDLPETATKSIQNHVARLRRSFASLDHELIETTASGYRLAVDPDAIDAVSFERLVADGRRRLATGDVPGAARVLANALGLWRGPAYEELPGADFAVVETARLGELRWAAMEDLAEARLEHGDFELVVADVERLVLEQPGREHGWGLLIRALYASGRQRDALAAHQRARGVLAEEFGLDPGPELRTLERRVLEQDPELDLRRAPAVPAGLRRDPNPFVGRDRELAGLVDAWRQVRGGFGMVRLVLGDPGAGRTRLAAELASVAVADGGDIWYFRGADDVAAGRPAGAFLDRVSDRSRGGPLLLVLDDAEWSTAATVSAITAVAGAIEPLPVMLLIVADQSAAGAALQAFRRLDHERARTLELDPLDDDIMAALVTADGVDPDSCSAVVSVARGLPGVARREAAAWAERVASDRLTATSASSIGATAAAAEARASVFDDVLDLVAARARRDELTSLEWTGRQPYRSLSAYDVQDADLFVGRERLVAELAARVLERRFVAVVGASGSGKSSLVRAGLVPLVRSGRLPGGGPWRTAVLVPGVDPISALDAIEDLDEPGRLLLVVDQFEEVFAAGVADAFSARLIELSADVALEVHIVIALRADQYPALAAVRPLAAVVEDAQVLVGPPTAEELRRIVEVPARRTGCAVDPALTERIADDVAGHEAALPLVSAALAEVWERRDSDRLTVDRYRELGGLAAAVPRMGSRAIESSGGELVRGVMLRLVDVTEDGQWIRRRISEDALPASAAAAVDALVDARLLHRADGQLDVVHEIVFSAWPVLAGWLEEARTDLLLDRELRAAARAWDTFGREDDYLYRGARLAAADEFMADQPDADPTVAEFVAASVEAAARAAEDRARHQARANRRLRGLLAGAGALLIVALAAGGLALRQADRADDSAASARAEATRAQARAVGEEARSTTEIDRALLLAVEAVRLHDSPHSRADLLAVLSEHPSLLAPVRRTLEGGIRPNAMGDELVAYSDGRLVVHQVDTFDVVGRTASVPEAEHWNEIGFSRDGEAMAVLENSDDAFVPGSARAFSDRPVAVYDGRSLDPAAQQLGGLPELAAGQDLSFSADGRYLAASLALFRDPAEDPYAISVLVWDLLAPAAPIARVEPGGFHNAVALSADGQRLYAAVFPPGSVRAYDTATGDLIGSVDGVGGRLGVSADGSTIAVTGLADGLVTVFDAATLSERARLAGPALTAFGEPALSEDGTRVAAPNFDTGAIYVWDVATGTIVEELVGHSAVVDGVWFSADGSTVHARTDDTVLAWDLVDGRRFVARTGPPTGFPPAELAAPLPDGGVAYVTGFYGRANPGGSVQVRAAGSDLLGPVIELGHRGIGGLSWRADGNRFASGGQDGVVRVWDGRSGALVAEHRVAPGLVGGVAYSSDDRRLIVAEEAGKVHALDAETLEPAGRPVDTHQPLQAPLRELGNGITIAVAGDLEHPVILVIDLVGGRVVRELDAPFPATAASPSPAGDRVAFGGLGGEVAILDARTFEWLGAPVVAHQALVSSLAWSADGDTVVSGGADGRLASWDGSTGALVGTVVVGPPDLELVPSFVEGSTVLAASADGSIYTWDTDPETWIELACAVAGRNLTEEEWREAFGDRPYDETCPSRP